MHLKKILLFSIFTFIFFSFSFAQFPGGGGKSSITGKVEGVLIDSLTQEPIGFASVVLIKPKSKKQVDGVITDEKGKFKFSNVKLGNFSLNISFIGYTTKEVGPFKLSPDKPDVDLKSVILRPESVALTEVTVEGKRAVIENKVDRIIYNAEEDVTNAGGNATDVLSKVPMVSVDMDGQVSLRGSQGVRILINGKPSGMFSDNVGDALKTIPADEIKKVEVITSPGAKYDGEGSAGIINIITKKKNAEGISGSVNLSGGTRQNSGVVSLNVAKGRFGFNTSASTYYSVPTDSELTIYRRNNLENAQISEFNQNGITEFARLGFYGKAGAFYDFNAYNSINTSFSGRGFNNNSDGLTTSSLVMPSLTSNYTTHLINDGLYSGFDWSTDYVKKFKEQEGRELTFAFQLSNNTNNRDYEKDLTYTNTTSINEKERSDNNGLNLEYTLQTDYTHPIKEDVKLEVGAKGVLRKIDSDFIFEDFMPDLNEYVINDFRTNIFNYNQDVYAGYVSMNYKIGGLNFVTGLRYENTQIEGSYDDGSSPFTNSYDNILPSVVISKQFKNFQTVKISYNRRIQRPSLFYINPYAANTDPFNIQTGNPQLGPEITDQIDLGYNLFVKGVVVNASLYYKYTSDMIERFVEINEQISTTRFQNLGTKNTYGFNVFSSGTIKSFWTLRGNLNVNYFDIQSNIEGVDQSNNGIAYRAFVSSSFKFKKGWKAEVFGFWNSPRFTLQGQTPSFSMLRLGVNKELFGGKGSIGVNAVEPFSRIKNFESELSGEDFYTTSNFALPFQSFGINFSYRFGKLKFKERRSAIKNNDAKQGDGNGGGGGGGMGGQ